MIIPLVQIHTRRSDGKYTLIPFTRNRDGLSVTFRDFVVLEQEEFRTGGFAVVSRLICDYRTAHKEAASQFDRMAASERIAFFKAHVSFLVSERGECRWEIDLMQPVGDGSFVLPIGLPHRAEFHPSEGSDRFIEALLRLMPSKNNRNCNPPGSSAP